MHEELKFDLCCGARILFTAGLSSGIAGHLSIMVDDNTMIANRFGPSFGSLTTDDILTLDLDGKILDGKGYVNDTMRLHGVIHRLNPGIVAVAHTHPPGVVSFSALRKVPEVYDQESCFLAGDVAVVEEDYSGLASTSDRVRPMAEALGQNQAIILPNHGAITRGDDIKRAVILMLALEGMVQRNLSVAAAGRATGITPRPIAPEVALATKQELNALAALHLVWEDLMAKLRKADPGFFAKAEHSATASPQ